MCFGVKNIRKQGSGRQEQQHTDTKNKLRPPQSIRYEPESERCPHCRAEGRLCYNGKTDRRGRVTLEIEVRDRFGTVCTESMTRPKAFTTYMQ